MYGRTVANTPRCSLAYAEMRLVLTKLLWNFDLELQLESEKWFPRHLEQPSSAYKAVLSNTVRNHYGTWFLGIM
jgi:hypothetical protein